MTRRRPSARLLLGLLALGLALWIVGVVVVIGQFRAEDAVYIVWLETIALFLAGAPVATILAARRPEHPVTWLLVGLAVLLGVQIASGAVATDVASSGTHPTWLVFLHDSAQMLTMSTLLPLLLLFPDGRLPSRRWRPIAVALALAAPLMLFETHTQSGTWLFDTEVNPFAIDHPLASVLATLGLGCYLVCVGACALAPISRFHAANGVTRQQLKVFALATASAFVVLLGLGPLIDGNDLIDAIVWAVAPGLVLAAVAVALVRYRLYDIDRLISRTVSYAGVTLVLAGVYGGAVLAFGALLGRTSDLAVAGSTLLVAALFSPARRRVQALVDHRFNRARYDAQRTVEGFRTRLRDEVDLVEVTDELLGAVRGTIAPAGASLWLRETR